MKSATQILDEAAYISLHLIAPGEGMNPSLLSTL